MEFAGNQASGGCYENFERFTPDEIRRHLILYSIQGLNPSPQLHMKMKHQREEPIQGCDAIANAMGANVKKRAQQFKKYFSVRHPYQEIPPQSTHPNWKIDPLLKHINTVSLEAVDLPENLAVDEQTIGFQGRSSNKQRIKHKKTGDGFQADALCCEGFTVSFYFRHQRAPKKYTDLGISPLHSRVLFCLTNSNNHIIRFSWITCTCLPSLQNRPYFPRIKSKSMVSRRIIRGEFPP